MNWKQFDQQRWQFLRYARREFRRALSKQIAPVIQALKDKGTHDTEGALVLLMDDKPMEDAFIKVYRRVGGHFGKETFKQYAKSDNDTWTQNVLKHIMNNGHEKIKGIDENNIKKIRAVIADGTQKGLGIDEIGRNIRSSVGSMQRATLIARTEVIAASNLGSIEGARATGLPMKKLWLSTPDDRTRPEHVSVDPVQTIDGLFMVGSDKMEYPGDIANGASAGNTINCRCAIGYDPYGRTENEGAERFRQVEEEQPIRATAKGFDNNLEIENITNDLIKELDIKGNVSVVATVMKGTRGSVGWVKNKDGTFSVGKNVKINKSMDSVQQKKTLRHEMRHVHQGDHKGMIITKDSDTGINWINYEGKKFIRVSAYNKILKQLDSRSPNVRRQAMNKYYNLPWEVDANNFMDGLIKELESEIMIDIIEMPEELQGEIDE